MALDATLESVTAALAPRRKHKGPAWAKVDFGRSHKALWAVEIFTGATGAESGTRGLLAVVEEYQANEVDPRVVWRVGGTTGVLKQGRSWSLPLLCSVERGEEPAVAGETAAGGGVGVDSDSDPSLLDLEKANAETGDLTAGCELVLDFGHAPCVIHLFFKTTRESHTGGRLQSARLT